MFNVDAFFMFNIFYCIKVLFNLKFLLVFKIDNLKLKSKILKQCSAVYIKNINFFNKIFSSRSLPCASASASSNGNISSTGSQSTPIKMCSRSNQNVGKKQSSSLFRVKILSVFQLKRNQESLPLPANSNGECLHYDSSASSNKKHCSTENVELRRSTSTNYRSKVKKTDTCSKHLRF